MTRPGRFVSAPALAVLTLVLGLAACQTTTPDATPLLDVARTDCVERPVTEEAHLLTLKPEEGSWLAVTIDDQSPCLIDRRGVPTLYEAFRLPETTHSYVLTVASNPLGTVMFAPRVLLLDATSSPVRELGTEAFQARGSLLAAMVRPRREESHLIVMSNPAAVGENMSRVFPGATTTHAATPYGSFSWVSGNEVSQSYVLSHSGQVIVSVRPLSGPPQHDR